MKPVRLYTARICWYCEQAKRLLQRKGIAFEEIDVSDDAEARHWLVSTTGQRTVPQIFIGDHSVGGYTELAALDKSGRLEPMLRLEG